MKGNNEQRHDRGEGHTNALHTDAIDPEMTEHSRYRLSVYRYARVRLHDELAIGTPRAIAVWTAGRAAGEHFDLEPAAWALLIHALLVSVAE